MDASSEDRRGFPPLLVGTWAWGDRPYWGYGERFGPPDVVDAFAASMDAGATYFDTAETYGDGESENILGFLLRKHGGAARVATKFALLRGRPGARALVPALRRSLARLRRPKVELHQIHWPDREMATVDELADALAEAVRLGLTDSVGVSNFRAGELAAMDDALRARGLRLASAQEHMSLLHRAPEANGVLATCRERGITLLGYSPLEQGLLSGRYLDPDARPAGRRAETPWFEPGFVARARPVVDEVRAVALELGAQPAQVALAWLVAQPGVVPVAGATRGAQAAENAAAAALRLPEDALERLERVSAPFVT